MINMELNKNQQLLLENGYIEIKNNEIKLTPAGAILFVSLTIKTMNLLFDTFIKTLDKK